jgi:squalene-associated FAD-dependent desaturase
LPKHSNNNSTHTPPIIVIGGGWSGLACAITLADNNKPIVLLESAPQLGGRARSVHFKQFLNTSDKKSRNTQANRHQQQLDNGQHIMLGAYHATLSLFHCLGIDSKKVLQRQTLELSLFSPKTGNNKKHFIHLKTPKLPAPLHLIVALAKTQGLSFKERFAAISMSIKLAIKQFTLKKDISVKTLLNNYQQSPFLIQVLWEPLCLATMNTPIHSASAQLFLNVLKDSFSHKRTDCDYLFFKQNLSQCFCQPAQEFIEQHKGIIQVSSKVIEISSVKRSFIIKTAHKQFVSDTIVLATPATISQKILSNGSITQPYLLPKEASLDFQYEPICTVYLQYPSGTQLPQTMIGLFNTLSQWVIDRALCQQDGLFAIVISGSGKHLKMTQQDLAQHIHNELSACLDTLPQFIDYQVIIEKKATFSAKVGIETQRPINKTQINGLFLAGDYTQTHYPSTIEGAVKSGISAAQLVLEKIKTHR